MRVPLCLIPGARERARLSAENARLTACVTELTTQMSELTARCIRLADAAISHAARTELERITGERELEQANMLITCLTEERRATRQAANEAGPQAAG